jgi:hypothetical protein
LKPRITHWDAVKHNFCYLKGTKDFWLTFGHKKTDLKGFADTDGNMAEDPHTISRYVLIINGSAIS